MADFDPNARTDEAGLLLDKIYCPACNRENKVGATFCAHCATYMGDLEDEKPAVAEADDAFASYDPEAEAKAAAEAEEAAARAAAAKAAMQEEKAKRIAAAGSSDPPPSPALSEDDGPDADVLDQPVTLPDGRVVKRASTLAKLQKLQKIVGDQNLLGGGGAGGGNEVVSYLEKKVAEQAAQIEALKAEKESIVAEFMADALEGDDDDLADALDKQKAKAEKLEAQLDEERAKREELSDKVGEKTDQIVALREEMATLKEAAAGDTAGLRAQIESELEATYMERLSNSAAANDKLQEELDAANARVAELEAGGGGGGGASDEEVAALKARVAELEAAAAEAAATGGEAGEQAAALEGELTAARGKIQELEGQVAEARAAAEAAAAAAPAGADPAELEATKAQLLKVSNAAKEQVQALTRYYERILARAPSGILVLDTTGVVLSLNPAAARLLAVSAAELIRKPCGTHPALAPLGTTLQAVFSDQGDGSVNGELALAEGAPPTAYTAGRAELGARQVCVVAFAPPAPEGAGGGPSADVLGSLQEDLFALRMMVELLSSKAGNEAVVTNVSQNLLGDIDRMVETLKNA